MNGASPTATQNQQLNAWVKDVAGLCQPERIHWCDGSEAEKISLTKQAVAAGVLTELNQEKLPGCYYHRSNPNDTARVEHCTFICTETAAEAGPTNNWAAPAEMYQKLYGLARGGMKGRTMFVVPYLMGPPGSPLAKIGVELTDPIYVVLSMRVMTRMGAVALAQLGGGNDFNRGLHCMLDVHPDRRFIAHFPQDNAIISVGSNYGGNVLLGKKCLALRLGSYFGHKEGWMAEHMLILGVESPAGEKTFVAAAFPSACGKTNFAMLMPPQKFQGWKIWTVGDDSAWMKPGTDGRLWAINPEAGYFGVVPGTSYRTNANAMRIMARDAIYTNVALTPDGDVWWEGKDGAPPKECLDWRGNRWTPESREPAAHPNSRFTAPMKNNPMLAPEADAPAGVLISAIIFGGRRATTLPLVMESFDWTHGVYLGATMGSETTAGASAASGQVRRDPMAMLPFCGYHLGDYFQHWLDMRKSASHPPKIFFVNWFRKGADGKFLWPGYGENLRVLQWMVARCHDRAGAEETPVGLEPSPGGVDLDGLGAEIAERFGESQAFDPAQRRAELESHREFFQKLYPRIPAELVSQNQLLRENVAGENAAALLPAGGVRVKFPA